MPTRAACFRPGSARTNGVRPIHAAILQRGISRQLVHRFGQYSPANIQHQSVSVGPVNLGVCSIGNAEILKELPGEPKPDDVVESQKDLLLKGRSGLRCL